MNFKEAVQAIAYNTKLGLKKHSPELLMGIGVISLGLTVYTVRKAAKKEDEYLAPVKEELKKLKEQEPSKENSIAIVKTYGKCVGRVARLYSWSALSVGVTLLSFGGATMVVTSRLKEMAAAYGGLLLNKRTNKFMQEDTVQTEDDGVPEVTEKKAPELNKKRYSQDEYGPFAMFFDCASERYVNEAQANMKLSLKLEEKLNNLIRARARYSPSGRGFVFIEDVHKLFKIPYTSGEEMRDAMINGWVYDIKLAKKLGENYMKIDLGLMNKINDRVRRGEEPVIIIDPIGAGPVLFDIKALDYSDININVL